MNLTQPSDGSSDAAQMKIISSANGIIASSILGNEKGCYEVFDRPAGGGNLLYTDYATKSHIYLSNQINSDHNNESDTSYLESTIGGCYLALSDDYLFIFKLNTPSFAADETSERQGYIARCDLDGADRQILTKLAANESIVSGCVACDGENLYYLSCLLQDDGTTTPSTLIQLKIADGTRREICQLDSESRHFIVGAHQDKIILKSILNPARLSDDLSAEDMLTAQQGIAMTVGGETANGCYSLDPYPDASADIIYYDYLTQECIRLSADANLGHDPASTAYIPSFKGGARCFVVGNYLYVIKNGQPYTDASVSGNDPTARIYSMALDGSDRKIQEYGSNVVFNWFGGVAGNGTDALFTIVSIVDPQKAEVKSALVKFGRNLSGYEILYEWNDDVVANLVGTCDDSFIATITSKSDPTKTEWISISQERVLRDNLLGDEKESNITSYTIYDGIMYYTKEKSAAVYRYDILHDVHLESLETDEYEDFLPSRTMISCEVRDSHLILYLANEALYKGTYASVDLDTMQIAPLNLYAKENGEDVFVGIFAEGEKDFLVRVG